jgi:hypothetical protein
MKKKFVAPVLRAEASLTVLTQFIQTCSGCQTDFDGEF